MLFVLGCLAMALFISSAFYVYTVGSTLLLAAFIPGFSAGRWLQRKLPEGPRFQDQNWRQVWADMKSPAAVLFSLFLFFQFGNEWTVAGWLALFLVRRVGMSPDESLILLAAYWLAILLGRVAAQWLLSRVGHGKLLFSSAFAAMLGSLFLMVTNNQFGAWLGTLLLGGGFAMIYPLAVEKIGGRFPNYHPGVFNGLFSIAVTGGLLAPALVSLAAHWWGIWVIMALPLVGTIAVLALTLLIWLEARLTGSV
jgi:fucose permease